MLLFDKLKYRLEDQNFDPIAYDPYMFVNDKRYLCIFLFNSSTSYESISTHGERAMYTGGPFYLSWEMIL